ncbi:DUF2961 domain-containing protein, partial [bacterium]|nr:DUF2961 domain-containing protein [bacterium]
MFFCISCGPPPPPEALDGDTVGDSPPIASQDGRMDTVYFLKRVSDLSSLARSYPGESLVLRSSHTPKRAEDAGRFVKRVEENETTWYVLAEEEGPGCITRLWLDGQVRGRLRIYFDGASAPAIESPIEAFFSGTVKPFTQPLVYGKEATGSGTRVSYFPLPFRKACRIELQSTTDAVKYQVAVRKFDADADIVTYNHPPDAQVSAAMEQLTSIYNAPAPVRYSQNAEPTKQITLKPGERNILANLSGPAAIRYLELK